MCCFVKVDHVADPPNDNFLTNNFMKMSMGKTILFNYKKVFKKRTQL